MNGGARRLGILLVDDSEDDVVLAREALASATLLDLLHVARDGREALRFLRRESPHQKAGRPDLVLLDVNMPVMNGFETLTELKRDPVLSAIPVIMLTVSDRNEDSARAYRAGAAAVIPKPADFGQFARLLLAFQHFWTAVARLPQSH
jgi:CheY-like chemotaxis protein